MKPEEVKEPKIDFNVSEEDLARHREEEKIKNNADAELNANMESSPDKNDFSLFSDMKNDDPQSSEDPLPSNNTVEKETANPEPEIATTEQPKPEEAQQESVLQVPAEAEAKPEEKKAQSAFAIGDDGSDSY